MKEPAGPLPTTHLGLDTSADRLTTGRVRLIEIFSLASSAFVTLLLLTGPARQESTVVRSAYGALLLLLGAAFLLRKRHLPWAGALASVGSFLLVTWLTVEHGGIQSPSGIAAYVSLVAISALLWGAWGSFVLAACASVAVAWFLRSSAAPLPLPAWQIWLELTFEFVLVAALAKAAWRLLAEASRQKQAHREGLRLIEQRLEESHSVEALGRLAGGVAHDFNNLLTVILGTTQLLEASGEKYPEIREDLRRIEDAANKAAFVTSQLLAVGRKQLLAPEVVEPVALVEALFPLLRRLMPPGIELTCILQPTGNILVDAPRLEHALINLITNAVQAMNGSGRVRVLVLERAQEDAAGFVAEIAVEDQGEGMTEEVRKRILEPFFTTKPHGVGTGLGLAMVDGFVHQCGGELSVESRLGEGSCFRMRFPVVTSAASPRRSARRSGKLTAPRRLLLVEPERDVRHAAQRLLEALGHEVVPAGGLTDIQEILASGDGNFDAMITALTLRDGTVGDLLSGTRAKLPDLPVVYVGGSPGEDAQDVYGHGPREALLHKPLSRESLHDGLTHLLEEA